jgi:hypothetical protein
VNLFENEIPFEVVIKEPMQWGGGRKFEAIVLPININLKEEL